MKLRSKLLLSATCLLTISVAATATSAYAWFISNRQATVAINKADVKTNATNLKIIGVSSQGGTVTPGKDNESTTIASTVVATDISGDGINFFKPRLSPGYNGTNNYKALKIEEVKPEQNYYHEFSLKFSQTNTGVKTGVYLGSGSTVASATKENLPLATRIAFSTDNFTNVKLYLAPKGADQRYYLKNKSDAEVDMNPEAATTVVGAFTDISTSNSNRGYNYSAALPTTDDDVTDATAKDDKPKSTFYLGELSSTTTTLTVTIRIWFEGMDKNCITDNIADDLSANLNFYGVNMGI